MKRFGQAAGWVVKPDANQTKVSCIICKNRVIVQGLAVAEKLGLTLKFRQLLSRSRKAPWGENPEEVARQFGGT